MKLFGKLPADIIRRIWEYDMTYKEYYDKNVIPFIDEDWAIKWIDRETGDYGLDYSHYDIFGVRIDAERLSEDPLGEYIYRLGEAKRICEIQNDRAERKNRDICFKPEHILKGDMDGTNLINHHHLTYLIKL